MDWSEIKPLKEKQALDLVSEYFEKHSLVCKKIDPRQRPPGIKSPDFEVFKADELQAYCEVKTPGNKLNEETGMFLWDTGFNKLRGFIHTAVKQFSDEDPKHAKPWIIAFTSNHPQLNYTSFAHSLRGAVVLGGQMIKDFRDKSFIEDSNVDLNSVDMFIWMQVGYIEPKIYQMKHFLNDKSVFLPQLLEISHSLTPTEDDGIRP